MWGLVMQGSEGQVHTRPVNGAYLGELHADALHVRSRRPF